MSAVSPRVRRLEPGAKLSQRGDERCWRLVRLPYQSANA